MKIQANIIKFIVNPVFYLLWHVVYSLAVSFLFIARIGLAIKELCVISANPQTTSDLAVSKNLLETPVH